MNQNHVPAPNSDFEFGREIVAKLRGRCSHASVVEAEDHRLCINCGVSEADTDCALLSDDVQEVDLATYMTYVRNLQRDLRITDIKYPSQ